MIDTENPSEPETKTTETENTTSILEGKLPVKGSIPDTRLPVKTKQELLPYEKENYSTIEKAIIELSEELANLSELRDSIEHSFDNKISADDKFQSEITSYFNLITKKFEEFNGKLTHEIDYNRELELKIQNNEYKGQIYLLERELNEERATITKTIDEINKVVKENLLAVSDKCRELKSANNIIEESISKFRGDAIATSENEFKALKIQCEKMLQVFTENAQKTLETVKKTSIDFITQCEKENKILIGKVPVVKGKLTAENWIVIIFGCIGIASFLLNLFIK
ncbi:MAG: hypothetical protein PUE59_11120 [Treponema sp.]|nr:hypothetical protein [Treponema sp.]